MTKEFNSLDDAREEYPEGRYLILTDDEANEQAKENIENSLWAFNSSFLSDETGLEQCIFDSLKCKYEDSNDSIKSLIEKTCGLESFVESTISADGRGHFMSSYDGDEIEIKIYGITHYLYRMN